MKVKRSYYCHLDDDEIDGIHEASLYILTEFGVKIDSENLKEKLQDYGCTLSGDRVRFSPRLIASALRGLSDSFMLKSPAGRNLIIDQQSSLAHPSGGMPFIFDSESKTIRNAINTDLESAALLVNRLDHLDLVSAFVYPQDSPPPISQLRQCECLLRHSEKPLFGIGFTSPGEAYYLVELFRIFAGSQTEQSPSFPGIVGISPLSPLYYPEVITDGMEILIGAGIPSAMFVAPIAGISAPLTIAGALAQMNANILAFTAIAYLINPKTPLVYAARLNFANMKSGHSNWGLPDLGIAGAVAVQIAKRYGYISDVYGLSTASCAYDGQSGFEKMNNALLPYLSGANMLSGSGALANLSVASLEQLVIDNEILAILHKIGRGVTVNSETLALDVIADVIGGGEFLAQDHTVKHLRDGEIFIPELSYTGSWSEWAGGSKKDITANAHAKVENLLIAGPEHNLPPEFSREINRVMHAAERTLLNSGHA